jgi:tetratricopeptide (TPR) repeat protein
MDYMIYAYMQLAQDRDAATVIEEAKRVTGMVPAQNAGPYALAAMPARYAIERGAWKEAAQLQPIASRFAYTSAMTHFARALGAAHSRDAAAADKDVQELARIVEALKTAKDSYWTTEVEVQRLGAAAWTAYARANRDEAFALMRAAADLEDQSEKNAVSPGRLVPARELLGEMLLESARPAEALAEFERSQVRDPNRFRSLSGAGKAAEQSGNREKARYYFKRLTDMAGAGDHRQEMEKARGYLDGN